MNHRLPVLVGFIGLICLACESDDTTSTVNDQSLMTNQAGTATETSMMTVDLSGTYGVTTVTCGGEEQSISVIATVTFDQNTYLEEWSFENSECTTTLSGRLEQSEESLTLVDVMVSCNDACTAAGIPCHSDPCSSDQVYQYNLDNGALLMSFTQSGDEFSCGPCGDGVEGTYLLTRN